MDNTTQEVEDFLRTHNIPFKALNHLPITTCEEGLKIAKEFGSTCCKTLLVKNKKQFFLFVIPFFCLSRGFVPTHAHLPGRRFFTWSDL